MTPPPAGAPPRPETPDASYHLDDIRVLLVEDNEGDAFLAKSHLEGYGISHATSLAKALQTLETESFGVALLDMHLPDGQGPELVRRILQRAPELPIVILSGSSNPDAYARDALKLGAQDWLSKQGLDADRLRRTIGYAIDRKSFERKFAESEERFRQLADNADTIFWIFNADFSKALYVNAAYDRITGTNREGLYTDPAVWQYLIHPDDRSRVIDAVAKLGRGEAPLDTRFRMQRPDNTTRWAHIRGFTIRDPAGEIYRVAGTIDDVTKLHQAEELVTSANLRLSSILETAAEGIYGMDLQGHITFANHAVTTMLGPAPEEIIGKDAHATFHHTRDDGTPNPVAECPIYQVVGDGITRRVEKDVFWRKDGSKLRVSYVTSPQIANGRVEGAVVVFADITERLRTQDALARAEARLRAMFDSSTSEIILTDSDGLILTSNKHGNEGVKIGNTLPLADPLGELLRAVLAAAHEGRSHRWVGEIPALGIARDVTVTPLGPPGAVHEILWEARDVTELFNARRTAEKARTRLEELQRLRVEFFALMAHEVNNPLTVLLMQMDLLKGGHLGELNPAQAKAVATLERGTDKLRQLTQDLFDVAKLQSGNMKLHIETVDLRKLAEEVTDEYQIIAEKNAIKLHASGESEVLALADKRRVGQVLANFLTNALKFTPKGGSITIDVGRAKNEAVLRVRDTGPGLTGEQISGLFEPFKQARDEDAPKGTGLGLYVSRGIATAHGGSVGCESPGPGKGSTFWLRLPIGADLAAGATPQEP